MHTLLEEDCSIFPVLLLLLLLLPLKMLMSLLFLAAATELCCARTQAKSDIFV